MPDDTSLIGPHVITIRAKINEEHYSGIPDLEDKDADVYGAKAVND